MTASKLTRIGTRGSALALAQAHLTRDALQREHADLVCRIDVIRTTGDAIVDRPLAEAGGKGLFTKEIDQAQLDGAVDLAVHSAKDLPTVLPEGLVLAGFLPREDVRDALISRHGGGLDDLPRGARVGTASLRRAAQLKRARPDLVTELLRGNVQTRLARVEAGDFDATLLALAGLRRLGLADKATAILPPAAFPPAVGQGAVALVARRDDAASAALLAPILDPATGVALAAERAFLRLLDGSCRTPIAGHCRLEADGILYFHGVVLRKDGSETFEARGAGAPEDAAAIGEAAAREILARLPAGVLDA